MGPARRRSFRRLPRPVDTAAALGGSAIRVVTRFPPLLVGLHLTDTRLQLDDRPAVARPWGETLTPVDPGRHAVRCYFRVSPTIQGDASITVDVPPDGTVELEYEAPRSPVGVGRRPGAWRIVHSEPTEKPWPPNVPQPPVSLSSEDQVRWLEDLRDRGQISQAVFDDLAIRILGQSW
jgi:hypothetical protein